VSTKARSVTFSDIPPLNEVGVPGFDVASWQMIAAPAKTPPAILDKLHDEIKSIVATQEIRMDRDRRQLSIEIPRARRCRPSSSRRSCAGARSCSTPASQARSDRNLLHDGQTGSASTALDEVVPTALLQCNTLASRARRNSLRLRGWWLINNNMREVALADQQFPGSPTPSMTLSTGWNETNGLGAGRRAHLLVMVAFASPRSHISMRAAPSRRCRRIGDASLPFHRPIRGSRSTARSCRVRRGVPRFTEAAKGRQQARSAAVA